MINLNKDKIRGYKYEKKYKEENKKIRKTR